MNLFFGTEALGIWEEEHSCWYRSSGQNSSREMRNKRKTGRLETLIPSTRLRRQRGKKEIILEMLGVRIMNRI